MHNLDVSVGKVSTTKVKEYHTNGPSSVFGIKNKLPAYPATQCYLWDIMETCNTEQKAAFLDGTAVTEDFVLVGTVGKDGNVKRY
jgi:hypothetical protein